MDVQLRQIPVQFQRHPLNPQHHLHQRVHIRRRLAEASADPAVRAVVITATGKGFCAGADLRGAPATGDRVAGDVARTIRRGAQRFIASILDCEKPVIAAVN
ncbi:enoyl-CoA hydratase/isomerase family protein, partial [Streptomyces beijiangensis]|nr:enoyl-CoA hydratase/isomerase family protein [Streptomyces beijiangensis]